MSNRMREFGGARGRVLADKRNGEQLARARHAAAVGADADQLIFIDIVLLNLERLRERESRC